MTATKPRRYAERTHVGIEQSKGHLTRELERLGATRRMIAEDTNAGTARAVIMFEREDRRYRITLPLRQVSDFSYTPARYISRTPAQQRSTWEQDCAERWRALVEYVKSLRVAHEAGIVAVEESLLPYAVLPDGRTVAEYVLPQLPEAASTSRMPPLLPGAGETTREEGPHVQ